MIIELSIENFLSIKDRITLSLDSSSSNKLRQNLIDLPKERLLKSVVIYGANATGKSNIVEAVFFLWKMVRNSHAFNVDSKVPRTPFKFDPECTKRPSKLEIVFIYKSIKYKYGFSCTDDEIIDEYLYHWPHGRKALIFNRTKTKEFKFVHEDKTQQELIRKQMNDNVLYLSRATQLGYEKTKNPYEFIVNHLVINYSPSWGAWTLEMIEKDPKTKEKIIDILQKADFGGINDIKFEKKKGWKKTITFGEKELSQKEEDAEVTDVNFGHEIKDGELVYLGFDEESEGTRKALAMLGPIFDILEGGKVAIIDEFESSLHPDITAFLVKLFNSKNNKNNAQLIFTTHETTLLNNDLFRRDQVYICSKKPNEHTVLNSLLDYDLRESSDFRKAYLSGRVGGLPFIDETIFD